MNYYPCDKCGRKLEQRMIVGAYKIAEKRKVKVCRDCAESAEYILTFLSLRKLGYTVQIDSRRRSIR